MVPGIGPTRLKQLGKGLEKALDKGVKAPPVRRPHTRKHVRSTTAQLRRLNRLKEWRTALGSRLSLDPSLLWPLTSLEQLAKAPHTLSSELDSDNIRHWQRDVVAGSLRDCLDSMR